MAFFEARLSLAEGAPDTRYQRAQIKTYQTLGDLLRQTLQTMKGDSRPGGHDDAGEISRGRRRQPRVPLAAQGPRRRGTLRSG